MSKNKKGRRRARAIAHARKLRQSAVANAVPNSGSERRDFLLGRDASLVRAEPIKAEPVSAAPTNQRTIDPRFSLFHYTTAAGLSGIVETKTLWATQANFLNDSAECQLLSALLTPRIKADFDRLIPALIKKNAFKPEIEKEIGSNAMTTEAEKVTAAILAAIDRSSPIHITSFCLHQADSPESEHGLLSQWRGYGRGGFAIEFDEGKLDDLADAESKNHSYQGLITRRVSYSDHEEAAQLSKFDGIANASLKLAFQHAAPNLATRADVREILGERELESYITDFTQAVAFLKSPRFMEENEYRIVALPTRSATLVKRIGDERPWKEKHFREGPGGTLVPYIRLFESAAQPLPIKKVIVGPHTDQKNQVFAAKLLLEKNEIEVPVVSSETTLRF